MAHRAGTADLPLHGGRVPAWLAERMARLGAVIAEAIVHRLRARRVPAPARPSVLVPVLRRGDGDGLAFLRHHHQRPRRAEARPRAAASASSASTSAAGAAGIRGRRRPSSSPPASAPGSTARRSRRASRLVAKVDSAAVQDGFELYLHGFILADDGKWVVVQQGMNGDTRYARRYHWLSEGLTSFVEAPHAAIDGPNQRRHRQPHRPAGGAGAGGAARAPARPRAGPDRARRSRTLERRPRRQPGAGDAAAAASRHAGAPRRPAEGRDDPPPARRARRGGRPGPGGLRRPPARARGRGADGRALAMVAEVVHGAPCRFADPARFSLAHGGKDRQPFPVPTAVYDQTIATLKAAVGRARLGDDERLAAIRRLDAAGAPARARGDGAGLRRACCRGAGALRTNGAGAASSVGSQRRPACATAAARR